MRRAGGWAEAGGGGGQTRLWPRQSAVTPGLGAADGVGVRFPRLLKHRARACFSGGLGLGKLEAGHAHTPQRSVCPAGLGSGRC